MAIGRLRPNREFESLAAHPAGPSLRIEIPENNGIVVADYPKHQHFGFMRRNKGCEKPRCAENDQFGRPSQEYCQATERF